MRTLRNCSTIRRKRRWYTSRETSTRNPTDRHTVNCARTAFSKCSRKRTRIIRRPYPALRPTWITSTQPKMGQHPFQVQRHSSFDRRTTEKHPSSSRQRSAITRLCSWMSANGLRRPTGRCHRSRSPLKIRLRKRNGCSVKSSSGMSNSQAIGRWPAGLVTSPPSPALTRTLERTPDTMAFSARTTT